MQDKIKNETITASIVQWQFCSLQNL